MALEDFLRQLATITREAPEGESVDQDDLGGADRTGEWLVEAEDVPCLVRPLASSEVSHTSLANANWNVVRVVIYFASDPLESAGGLTTQHRITVGDQIYAVLGVIDPNSMGRIIQANCEGITTA